MQRLNKKGRPVLPAGPQLAKTRQEGHQEVLVEDVWEVRSSIIRASNQEPSQ